MRVLGRYHGEIPCLSFTGRDSGYNSSVPASHEEEANLYEEPPDSSAIYEEPPQVGAVEAKISGNPLSSGCIHMGMLLHPSHCQQRAVLALSPCRSPRR